MLKACSQRKRCLPRFTKKTSILFGSESSVKKAFMTPSILRIQIVSCKDCLSWRIFFTQGCPKEKGWPFNVLKTKVQVDLGRRTFRFPSWLVQSTPSLHWISHEVIGWGKCVWIQRGTRSQNVNKNLTLASIWIDVKSDETKQSKN